MGGPTKMGPLLYRLPALGECSRNQSVSVHQLVVLWATVFGFSEFFLGLFQHVCPFHYGWFTSSPALIVLSVQQFLTKNDLTPCPTLPIHQISPWVTFFCCPVQKKSPQRETLCWCGRGGIKNDISTKRHQNWWVQKLFEQWKKSISIGVLHQMERTLKVTEL